MHVIFFFQLSFFEDVNDMSTNIRLFSLQLIWDIGLMKCDGCYKKKYFEIAATSVACLLLDDNINNNNNINSTTLRPNRTAKQIDRKEIKTSSGAQGPLYYI